MFTNLIESASHQQDLARKGRFFLATLISYALVVTCAGLVSIYAYDTHLAENQDLEFIGLVPPILDEQRTSETKKASSKAAKSDQKNAPAQRTEAIDRVAAPTKVPDTISADKSSIPEIPKSGIYKIGPENTEAIGGLPGGDPNGTGDDTVGPVVKLESAPPQVIDKPVDPPARVLRKSSVLNGDATSLPKPPYPPLAKQAGIQGPVNVQVTIDETGKIVSARASSGNMLLRSAAEQAAFRARFNPTRLNGVPVKVSGIITYNFTLQ